MPFWDVYLVMMPFWDGHSDKKGKVTSTCYLLLRKTFYYKSTSRIFTENLKLRSISYCDDRFITGYQHGVEKTILGLKMIASCFDLMF